MTEMKTLPRAVILITLTAIVASLFPLVTQAVTRAQVEEACSDSRAQLREYRAAQVAFEESTHAYHDAVNSVERVRGKQDRVEGSAEGHSEDLLRIQAKIEAQAIELYMRGGISSPGIILSVSSVDEFMTTSEFLAAAASGGQQSIDELIAVRNELARFNRDLDETRIELEGAEAHALAITNSQQEAMEAEQSAYADLSGECRTLAAKYDAEQAARAAAAAARARGSVQVGPFVCPFTPGRTSFVNSWGAPRSGGRTHKGTDLFAAWNEPMYAVASGTVITRTSGLGGRSIWLLSSGVAYYYAHLAGWNVSNGQKVSQGQTIGFNGDSGNARGGAPHVHFEIHPGGRSAPAVNPYPTLVAVCR